MIKNHLKIAWRQLLRNPGLGFINVFGLGTGLAAALLILGFVLHERSYDRMYAAADEIVRMGAKFQYGDQTIQTLAMSAGVGPLLTEQLPEVTAYLRTQQLPDPILRRPGGPALSGTDFLLADPTVFDFFALPGTPPGLSEILAQPNQLLLTASTAERYFGTEPAVGQILRYNGALEFTVAGVIPDPPSNTTFQYQLLAGLDNLRAIERLENPERAEEDLSLNNTRIQLGSFKTFLRLRAKANPAEVSAKIAEVADGYAATEGATTDFVLEALPDLHLRSIMSSSSGPVRLATWISLLILLLALVNYFNLTTAGALRRAKATGIRKIVGGSRGALIRQFYTESALICSLALGVAVGLLFPLRILLDRFLDVRIDPGFYTQPLFLGSLLALFIGLIVLAGAIPAIVLSRFSPLEVLRNRLVAGPTGRRIRQGLIWVQFGITTTLVLAGITVQRQVSFWSNQDLGIEVDQVLALPVAPGSETSFAAFRSGLVELVGADRVCVAGGRSFQQGVGAYFIESPANSAELSLMTMSVDPAFFDFFGLDWVIAPRESLAQQTESPLVLNERALLDMGMEADQLDSYRIPLGKEGKAIAGVVKNFNYQALRSEVKPLALFVSPALGTEPLPIALTYYVSIAPDQPVGELLRRLERLHAKAAPDQAFDYHFLDETFAAFYATETRLAQLIRAFTLLAILLSCLGLIGLSLYATQQRAREIGLRKVLGASAQSIVALLNRDFLWPVLLSLIPAFALAYYFLRGWLDTFAYRIELSWWLFALAGLIVIVIALLTVSLHSVKAVVANPVDRLRE